MDSLLFTNNAKTTITEELEIPAMTVFLAAGRGALFPVPTEGTIFIGTLANSTGTITEIVHCTARDGDTLTVVRAQEGTTALLWPVGSKFELLVTAGTMEDVVQVPQAQAQSFNYAEDTGTANAYAATLDPPIVDPPAGMPFRIKIGNDNTGPSTFNGAPIVRGNGSALIGRELIASMIPAMIFDGESYQWNALAPTTPVAFTAGQDDWSAVTPKLLKWENLDDGETIEGTDLLALQQGADKLVSRTANDVAAFVADIVNTIPQITLAQFTTINIPDGVEVIYASGRDAPGDGGAIGLTYFGMSPPAHPAYVGPSLNGKYFTMFGDYLPLPCFVAGDGVRTIKPITNITQALPAVVTCTGHGRNTGDRILINSVFGMTEINMPLNTHASNPAYTIIKLSDDSFSLNLTAIVVNGTYVSGTGVITVRQKLTPLFQPTVGSSVVLLSLTGTGAFAALNGTWTVLTAATNTMTLQGPIGAGAATLTGGSARFGVNSTAFGAYSASGTADFGWTGTDASFGCLKWLQGAQALRLPAFVGRGNFLMKTQNIVAFTTFADQVIYGDKGHSVIIDQGSVINGTMWSWGTETSGVNLIFPAASGVTTTTTVARGTSMTLDLTNTALINQGDYIAALDLSQNIIYRDSPLLGVTNITQTYPAVVTVNADYDYIAGDIIAITGITGMTQINGVDWRFVEGLDSRTFTINADATPFGAYISGGSIGSGGLAGHIGQLAEVKRVISPTQIELTAPPMFLLNSGTQIGVWNNPIENITITGITFRQDPVYHHWAPGITPTLSFMAVIRMVIHDCNFEDFVSRQITWRHCIYGIGYGNIHRALPNLGSNAWAPEGQSMCLHLIDNIKEGGQHFVQCGGNRDKVNIMFCKMEENSIYCSQGAALDTHWSAYAFDFNRNYLINTVVPYNATNTRAAAVTLRGYGLMNVVGNVMQGWGIGVRAHDGGGLCGGLIQGNTFKDAGYGIYADNFDRLKIHDNYFLNSFLYDIWMQYSNGPTQGLPVFTDMSVRGINSYGDQAVPALLFNCNQNNPLDRTKWDWANFNIGSKAVVGTGVAASIIDFIKPSITPEVGQQGFGPPYPMTAAATVDIGLSPKVEVIITGTTQITSLGSSYPNYMRLIIAGASFTIKAGATILTQYGLDLEMTSGAMVMTFGDNSSPVKWRLLAFTPTVAKGYLSQLLTFPTTPPAGIYVEWGDDAGFQWRQSSNDRDRGFLSETRRNIGIISPDNATTFDKFGGTLTALSGTITAVAATVTNAYTRQNRQYVASASAIHAGASWQSDFSVYMNDAGRVTIRGGWDQNSGSATLFMGLKPAGEMAAGTQPTTIANALGLCCNVSDTQLRIVHNSGASTGNSTQLGSPYLPYPASATVFWEINLWWPNAATKVWWELVQTNADNSVNIIKGTYVSPVVIPDQDVPLRLAIQSNTREGATANFLSVMKAYAELR